MFDIADEVFVVGPLGKMIVEDTNSGVSLKAFNEALHYSDGAPTEDRKPYVKVPISDTTRVFAVTTYRGNAGSVFAKHSDEVRSRLYNQRNKVWQLDIQRLEDSEFTKVLRSSSLDAFGHVMVRFNHFGVSEGIERLLEMPHSNIRHPDVARRFFGVPAAE